MTLQVYNLVATRWMVSMIGNTS